TCALKGTQENPIVELQLIGYDRTLLFSRPDEKIQAVYNVLRGGGNVVLLVKEGTIGTGEPIARIWEVQSKGSVFLQYEDVAQWHKSDKMVGLYVGLGFLGGAGFFVWMLVWGRKKGWFK
ncbi:unnamed protein product, partial [marine sediment metagenome]